MTGERGEHFVQSFERGLAVLRAFTAEHPERTLTEVAGVTNLTRAGARRLLLTLVDLGYLRLQGRYFSLTPRVLEFGHAFLSGRTLPKIAEPHLQDLAQELTETTSVAILDGTDIYYIARVPSAKLMSTAIPVGTRFPAYATSMGKVLLAGLPVDEMERRVDRMELEPLTPRTITSKETLQAEVARARGQGWATADGEVEKALHGVAVPIRDRSTQVIAAANVSLQTHTTDESQIRRDVIPSLLATASRIEADLELCPEQNL